MRTHNFPLLTFGFSLLPTTAPARARARATRAAAITGLAGFALALQVHAGSFNANFNSGVPTGANIFGDAAVDTAGGVDNSGVLKLTSAVGSKQGSFVIDDLDGGQPIEGFVAKFKLYIGGGTAADGFSFNFAPDVADGPFGEEGTGTGLTVEFDTYDNGLPDTAPSIDLKLGGTEIAVTRAPYLRTNTFVDVLIQAKDGAISVNYAGYVVYTNYFAFVPTAGRFGLGARTGGANDNHWVDDLSITTTPLSGPYVSVASPTGAGASPTPKVHLEIKDATAAVNPASVQLQFDGAAVTAAVNKSGTVTSVDYTPAGVLAPASIHSVGLAYADNAATPRQRSAQFSFTVLAYTLIPDSVALPPDAVDTGKAGFTVRPVQARTGAGLANSVTRTEAQLAGTLIDSTTGQPFDNKAIRGPNADGSYNEDNVINYDIGAVADFFPNDTPFPGIPGSEGSTDNCAEEILTFLQLDGGFYKFGVTSDDGFKVSLSPNPKDAFAPVLGLFDGGRAFAETTFGFVTVKPGLYPVRLVWENGTGDANLEFYSINPDTKERLLINDRTQAKAIKAYRVRKAAYPAPAYISSVSPRPNATNVKKTPQIVVVLADEGTQVDQASIQLLLNGVAVTPVVAKANQQTTVTYQHNTELGNESTNTVRLVFKDNATPPNVRTQDWQFVAARVLKVVGQWDFDNGDLKATIGQDLDYGDGPTGRVKNHTSFGTTTAFGIPDINGKPARVMKYTRDEFDPDATDKNPRGYLCHHGIAPNGGGTKVNQWTLIMDIMWPDLHEGDNYSSFGKWEAVDDFAVDGSLFARGNDIGGAGTGGIGISGNYNGDGRTNLVSGQWHRVTIATDMAAQTPVISSYIDGVKFHDQTAGARWGFDARHAWPPVIRLYADGENDDEVNTFYVNSVQIRNGTMSEAEISALGGPSADGIPVPNRVAGQWDFDNGDLRATVGQDLQYGDPAGRSEVKDHTQFGTTTSFGIPDIGGQPAKVMKFVRYALKDASGKITNNVPGYLAQHNLAPNGGGKKVNQWTLIFDVLFPNLHEGDNYSSFFKVNFPDDFTKDGDFFVKGNDIGGPGTGGIGIGGQYTGDGRTFLRSNTWHRVVVAVDQTAKMLTQFIDGVKFQDQPRTDGTDGRYALSGTFRLFSDGEGDDEVNTFYVNSVQLRDGKLSDDQIAALGGPSATGIPLQIPELQIIVPPPPLGWTRSGTTLTLSWPATLSGFALESTDSLTQPKWQAVSGVVNNTATITIGPGAKFYRLKKP